MRYKKILFIFSVLLFTVITNSYSQETYNYGYYLTKTGKQTLIEKAKFITTQEGIPMLEVEGLGKIEHPALIAIYALQYGGGESFFSKKVEVDNTKFLNCIHWLEENQKEIKTKSGDSIYVWLYNFDNIYNNVYIKAPWYSSFAQAIGIEAFLLAFEKTSDSKYIELAERAAKVLFVDINDGGLLFKGRVNNKDIIWFEEIPAPAYNPPHILNAHLRTLIALYKLYKITHNEIYKNWFKEGLNSLKIMLPLYDTGYWLKYDLNLPDKILLRFNNPYGNELYPLAIEKIEFEDNKNKIKYAESLGQMDDFNTNKKIFISGIDWQVESKDGEKDIRRLKSVLPSSFTEEINNSTFLPPHTYVYISIPKQKNNLRTEPFFIKITYKDEKKSNINLQIRSIMPKINFIDIPNGNLLLEGSSNYKTWLIPIYTKQIGWFVGELYAEKHYLYLKEIYKLSKDNIIGQWTKVAYKYLNSIKFNKNKYYPFKNYQKKIFNQTPAEKFKLDKNGVLMVGIRPEKPKYNKLDNSPNVLDLVFIYHPFAIAQYQIIEGENFEGSNLIINRQKLKREPGLNWLIKNAKCNKQYCLWYIPTSNTYNDIFTKSNWQSAFVQAYVIKALIYAYKNMGRKDLRNLIFKAVNAYAVPTYKGGLSTISKEGYVWFEEVPNNTHILNAHLVSLNTLYEVYKMFSYKPAYNLYKQGIESLTTMIYKYDNGYWTLYDQNPKKELLFQIDWIEGTNSPLIDEICLLSPYSLTRSCIDVGSEHDGLDLNQISGIDWNVQEKIDNTTIRSFKNGYKLRNNIVQGGSIHNVFFKLLLPDKSYDDLFNIGNYYLLVRYKDVAKGEFVFKIQSNNEGNVLKFVPLTKSLLITNGDNKWKFFIIPIKNTDLGWYVGIDYQKYHIAQLEELINKEKNQVLQQYLSSWKYYISSINKEGEKRK